MAINPHRKGGTDVPVTDGGTGASTSGSALTNLGGLDSSSHAAIDHSGLPGVSSSGALGIQTGMTSGQITVPAGTITTAGQYCQFILRGTEVSGTANSFSCNFGGGNVFTGSTGNAQDGDYFINVQVWFAGGTTWHYASFSDGSQPAGTGQVGSVTADPTGSINFTYSMTAGDGGEQFNFVGGHAHL